MYCCGFVQWNCGFHFLFLILCLFVLGNVNLLIRTWLLANLMMQHVKRVVRSLLFGELLNKIVLPCNLPCTRWPPGEQHCCVRGMFVLFTYRNHSDGSNIIYNYNLQFFNPGIFWHLFCREHTLSDTESNLLFSELMREVGQLMSSVRDFNEDHIWKSVRNWATCHNNVWTRIKPSSAPDWAITNQQTCFCDAN